MSTFNVDTIYVDDNLDNGDGFYLGLSAIQRLRGLGGISSAFRINNSFALDDEVGGNVIGDGTLLSVELSKLVVGSEDIVYFNPFWGIGNYTQAGREPILGGPLASLGILYELHALLHSLESSKDFRPYLGSFHLGRGRAFTARPDLANASSQGSIGNRQRRL